jgi:hypothetical protein
MRRRPFRALIDTKFVLHYFRVVKNVTISMDENLAAWVRVEAAKADKSVSAWIAEVLAARRAMPKTDGRRGVDASGKSAMDRFLERGPYDLGFKGKLPSREEMNERESLRRFESSAVRERSERSFEADDGKPMAKKSGSKRRRHSKPAGSS